MKFVTLLALVLMIATPAKGADWASEVELGAVVSTGNTEQENFKLRAQTSADTERFGHLVRVDALRSAEDDLVTAQKYYAFYQADFKLDDYQSLFGRLSYEDDRFSGFDYQADATAGYSRRLFQRPNMELVGDVGGGFRRTEFDTGVSETEFITRFAAKFEWVISDSAKFRQRLSTEIGEESTISRSESSLQSTIVGALAMKLALNIKHQSEVPVGKEKTDTETSITLVYSF